MKDFLIYLASGFIAGIPGGMGLGGGTLLIPILTIFCKVNQHIAQATNLISFIPMAIVAIIIHAKNKLITKKGLGFLIIPAGICAVGAGFLSNLVQSQILQKIFGGFLILTGFFAFFADKFTVPRKKDDT